MKVIVDSRTDAGGTDTIVYNYSQEKMRELIENEYNWIKKNGVLMNEDEVQEILSEDEIYYADIRESDYCIHYEVCEVK